jgi:membrane carboxypeptidase/penicillin-binding protein PbpC
VICLVASVEIAYRAELAGVPERPPSEFPDLPPLVLDAASLQFLGTARPVPRFGASTLAARVLLASSGREVRGVSLVGESYALAVWIARNRTPEAALASALAAMPFGEDCIGIEDAALRYMHQPLRQLDAARIAALVVLARSPRLVADRDTWRAERDALLGSLRARGAIDDARLHEATARPIVPSDWEVRPR